ncbi:MAG: alcohol dehydrogenase catalytic domain-containing protein, partial [Candidatus Aminicenantaceae bacterium]
MKAMLLNKFALIDQNPLKLTDVPEPVPRAEDILIRINVCGICHTDLHTIEGELPDVKLPIIPGH